MRRGGQAGAVWGPGNHALPGGGVAPSLHSHGSPRGVHPALARHASLESHVSSMLHAHSLLGEDAARPLHGLKPVHSAAHARAYWPPPTPAPCRVVVPVVPPPRVATSLTIDSAFDHLSVRARAIDVHNLQPAKGLRRAASMSDMRGDRAHFGGRGVISLLADGSAGGLGAGEEQRGRAEWADGMRRGVIAGAAGEVVLGRPQAPIPMEDLAGNRIQRHYASNRRGHAPGSSGHQGSLFGR